MDQSSLAVAQLWFGVTDAQVIEARRQAD